MKTLVIVLLVLTVLFLIPVGIDGGYKNKNFVLGLKIGFLNLRLFPRQEREEKPRSPKQLRREQEKKLKKALKKALKKTEQKEKPIKTPDIKGLLAIGLRALGRLRRRLRVDYLRLRYTLSGGDPFSTALGYGAGNAMLGVFVPLIDKAFDIRERDIGLDFDFLSEDKSIDCWLTMTIQIWEIFYVAAALGFDFLKQHLKRKKEDRLRKE